MGLRFKLLAALYLLLVISLTDRSGMMLGGGVGDVFVGLGSLLVFAVIALWPNSTSVDRVDRNLGGRNWADRIEFDTPSRD